MGMKDYRKNQFRKDWWDGKVPGFWRMTRNDLMWVGIGIVLGIIAIKFPINWDHVFGLRP